MITFSTPKLTAIVTAFVSILFIISCDRAGEGADLSSHGSNFSLWYDRPAAEWLEALPVGNGSMGAMVYGGVHQERIQFNENTLWTGSPHDYAHEGASAHLEKMRELLFEGEQAAAEEIGKKHFMGVPVRQQAYQPFGDLHLQFEGHENPVSYQRELDLETGLATTRYKIGPTTYTRTVFASYPDQAVFVRIEADEPGAITFSAHQTTPLHERENAADVEFLELDDRTIAMQGQLTVNFRDLGVESGMRFESRVQADADGGVVTTSNSALEIRNANAVTLILSAATSFENYKDISGDPAVKNSAILDRADGRSYDDIKQRHVSDHYALFSTNTINLGGGHLNHLPANERILAYQGNPDPAVTALLYQYGRYLLIASSRPGSQPANLQGVWNKDVNPAWDSKYTVNVNIEMNYWPAEMTGLSETAEPLFDFLEDISETGGRIAEIHYGLPGWVLHHNSDIWRGAAPVNFADHGIWPTGGAWMVQNFWWRYLYTGDEEFLKERAYPIMKESCRFFLEYLVEDPIFGEGWLVSGPSNSPERGGLVMGPAMDHQILRYLFRSTAQAAAVLGVDDDFQERLLSKADRIAPDQIGSREQLQEWLYKEDPDSRHRHVSHLWDLHPGNGITPETPELFNAAQRSLDIRGDGGTGWSRAWKINIWARFLNGERAHRLLRGFLEPADDENAGVYANFFGAHPPFQIDGNFGATSGIAEMLLQSHRTFDTSEISDYDTVDVLPAQRMHVLPAVPELWESGEITGLRARGGFILDFSWRNGELSEIKLQSNLGRTAVVEYDGRDLTVEKNGAQVAVDYPESRIAVFPTEIGAVYVLK